MTVGHRTSSKHRLSMEEVTFTGASSFSYKIFPNNRQACDDAHVTIYLQS